MNRLMAALLVLFSCAGFATTVYKTVDENGVVGFSDSPPQGVALAEVLNVNPAQPRSPQEHLARLEAMREATARLASDRREREKHRAQLREIRARTAAYQPPAQSGLTQYADYYPVYSRAHRRVGRPPYRPGFKPKPVQPILPGRAIHSGNLLRSSNSQLMRPLVSTRR